MRPLTIVGFALVAILAFGLFALKYEVRGLEAELERLEREARTEQEAIRVLNAEWSYLNRPERLQALSERHLPLAAVEARQIGDLDLVPRRIERAAAGAGDEGAEQ